MLSRRTISESSLIIPEALDSSSTFCRSQSKKISKKDWIFEPWIVDFWPVFLLVAFFISWVRHCPSRQVIFSPSTHRAYPALITNFLLIEVSWKKGFVLKIKFNSMDYRSSSLLGSFWISMRKPNAFSSLSLISSTKPLLEKTPFQYPEITLPFKKLSTSSPPLIFSLAFETSSLLIAPPWII